MVLLALEVRVQQRFVAFATAPKDVVFAPEGLRYFERFFHLGRGVGENMGIRICRRPAHVARVGEQIGGAPQQPDARGLLQ